MASRTSESLDLYERIGRVLDDGQEPGAAEVCDLVRRILDDDAASAPLDLERLKTGVYRLRIGNGAGRSVVLKCLKPALAQTDRLVVERWLPALGLGDRSPRIVAAGAERDGCWVWHAYEDVGDDTLRRRDDPDDLDAAISLIAALHTRAAVHPLMPEIRWRARDYGVHYFTSNLRDAIGAVEALGSVTGPRSAEFAGARARVLENLYRLREDAPRRVQALEAIAIPETLLHGDLWPNGRRRSSFTGTAISRRCVRRWMNEVAMRWLIVTADDFGITSGINRGIVQAHRQGVLTSTSLMVDRPACVEAAALARENGTLSVGIHLELDPNAADRVPAELERQCARFVELVGTVPTHADSHHD